MNEAQTRLNEIDSALKIYLTEKYELDKKNKIIICHDRERIEINSSGYQSSF